MNKPVKTIFAIIFAITLNIGSLTFAHAASADALINLTNASRAQNGLADLTLSDQLTSATLAKANDMFSHDYFAHTSPTGKTPWDFIKAAGYDYTAAGENLAIGYTDDQELHEAWMNSATHRANILNANSREIGLAVVSGEYEGAETIIVVQMFGTPAAVAMTNMPQVESTQAPTAPAPSFTLDQNKTGFTPTQIFAGEKVKFTVALVGEAQEILVTAGEQKIDLMETAAIQQDGETKIYTQEVKIEKAGDFPVNLTITNEANQTETQNLGTLRVAEKSIVKNSGPAATQKTKDFINKNIIPISVVFSLLILSLIIVLIYRFRKNGRLLGVDLLPKL